jgi:excisionase family DNA binding protein
MAHAIAEPQPIGATEDEQVALSRVDRFLAQVADAGQAPARLVAPDGNMVELPASVFRLLREVVHHLVQGQAITLMPIDAELTTQQAADLLNVSRPYLVKLLEQGAIPYTKTGTHRRIRFADVMTYRARRDAQRSEALTQLTQLSQAAGLYDVVSDRTRSEQ